jgi:hypothetical protein
VFGAAMVATEPTAIVASRLAGLEQLAALEARHVAHTG